jgi:hypothetical protein
MPAWKLPMNARKRRSRWPSMPLKTSTSARPLEPGAVITSAAPSPLTSAVAMRTPEVIRFGYARKLSSRSPLGA